MTDPDTADPRVEQLSQRNSLFIRIWAAIFLAALATFFLLMTLSARVFSDTGSAFAANTVVLTQWLPAVLALPLIKAAVSRYSARALLVVCELGSAIALPLVLVLFGQITLLIGLLLIKGAFDALSKVSRTVALKSYFTGKALDSAASYYNTAALAGGGVGALVGAVLLGQMELPGVLALCCGIHLSAGAIYLSMPRTASLAASSATQGAPAEPLNLDVRAAIVYFVATVCLYQGFHNIARSVFPVIQLGMPEAGIALVQTLTNFAYIVGAFAAARLPLTKGRYATTGPLLHILAMFSVIPLSFMSSEVPGLSMYALFAFMFEMAFCVHLRQIITCTPSTSMARTVADTNALAVGSMVCFSLLGSWVVDKTGLGSIAAFVVAAAVATPLLIHFLNRRTKAAQQSKPSQQG